MRLNRGIGLAGLGPAIAILALLVGGPVGAQESLDSGKSGAQLFASDCAICHKTPQSVAKASGPFGVSGFLREHYTASRESAGIIAAYLDTFSRAPANRGPATKRTAKGDDKSKAAEKKSGAPKSGDSKSDKPVDAKTSQPKTSEPKPSEFKTNDILAPEPRSPAAPAAKPEKPEKSD